MHKCLSEVKIERLQKYKKLERYIRNKMSEILKKLKENATLMIRDAIMCESSHINYDHEDFQYLKPFCMDGKVPEEHDFIRMEHNLKIERRIFDDDFKIKPRENNKEEEKRHEGEGDEERKADEDDYIDDKVPDFDANFGECKTNFKVNELLPKDKDLLPTVELNENIKLNAATLYLSDVSEKLEVLDAVSRKRAKEVTCIFRIVVCYFAIVKKQIKDCVEKKVIAHLVKKTMHIMVEELISSLDTLKNSKKLLEGDDEDIKRKKQLQHELKDLRQALNKVQIALTESRTLSKEIFKKKKHDDNESDEEKKKKKHDYNESDEDIRT